MLKVVHLLIAVICHFPCVHPVLFSNIPLCTFKYNFQIYVLLLFREHKVEWQEISVVNLTPVTVIKRTADANSKF